MSIKRTVADGNENNLILLDSEDISSYDQSLSSVYGIKEYDKTLFVSLGALNILQLFGQLYHRISESPCVIKCV
uniref:Uncharacterized protein n=1 Tax=Physcomitrium patens TaxID=3218 RepID=A0A7I4CIJ5_PHYPA